MHFFELFLEPFLEPFWRIFWGLILDVILGLWDGAGVVSVGDGGVWCRWERERGDVVGGGERERV